MELYERIETIVVQGEEEGDIVIETKQYEQSTKMFVDNDTNMKLQSLLLENRMRMINFNLFAETLTKL